MATIINNPQPIQPVQQPGNNGGSNFLLGVILIIIVLTAVFYYGLPYLRSGISSAPQVNVPSQINVNVKQPQK
ncbi:MAG: hypothetical protein ACR2LN_00750 [Candidatus Levyibacteriota bacterium]